MIPSERLHKLELLEVTDGQPEFGVTDGETKLGGHRFGMQISPDCTPCQDRQRLQDYAHHAAPYFAGPFMHGHDEPELTVERGTIQPPHSKFHPVPTRPVFEVRDSYPPPQPMGVQLVPVPDTARNSMESTDLDSADSFILTPPSN